MTARKSSFAPVVDVHTRVLVLGSLPGERSLSEQRYYAHPRNLFWRLIGAVIGCDLESLDYEARLAALLAHRVGLWDSVGSARREGSLDTAIRDARTNALADLVATLPDLRAVGFNGAKSFATGAPLLEGAEPALVALPSSSPAFAAMPFAEKRARWLVLGEYLR